MPDWLGWDKAPRMAVNILWLYCSSFKECSWEKCKTDLQVQTFFFAHRMLLLSPLLFTSTNIKWKIHSALGEVLDAHGKINREIIEWITFLLQNGKDRLKKALDFCWKQQQARQVPELSPAVVVWREHFFRLLKYPYQQGAIPRQLI